MSLKVLQQHLNRVILQIGDLVIDTLTGHTGTLLERRRHIDMEADDVYLWKIKWFDNGNMTMCPASLIEEEGLKRSIVVGTYQWHSINGGTFELECI
tara:strand:- start:77 stop:367 length:291 start_codon:yes stop_codon:yes gene_type:complete